MQAGLAWGTQLGQHLGLAGSIYNTGSPGNTLSFSGLNVYVTGSLVSAVINDSNGAIISSSTGSPASYGAFVQAGNTATSAGSVGVITFGKVYASSWYGTLTAGSLGNFLNGSQTLPYFSGTQSLASGVFIGAPSTTYNWIAVGI